MTHVGPRSRRDDDLDLIGELERETTGWFDEPPEPLGPEPVDRISDRLLTVLAVALLLITVAAVVGLVVLAGLQQGTWS